MFDPALDAAYRNTDYWVADALVGPFAIRIGEVTIELEELLYETVEVEWTYLTACNPGSRRLASDENARRSSELAAMVRERGWRYFHGESVGCNGDWPPESSLLVLGVHEGKAIKLARRFGQNAVVVGRIGEAARLVWVG
jgi:hypothetical protein